MTLAPETPRFLVLKGRIKGAFRVLERISGPEEAHREIADIQTTMHLAGIDRMQPKGSRWGAMLRPGVRRALLISACLAVLIHISGINTVIDYAPAIFESAGWHTDSALASTMVIGVTQFLFSLVSFWAIDRYGRKPLYIIGSIGMSFSVASLAIAAVLGRFHGNLVLVLILGYLAFFSSCIGPVFWTLVPELFPNDVRGTAMSVPVLIQWFANAGVVLVFPFVFHRAGKEATFGFLALMSLAQGAFAWFCVPETKNRSLEEIEALFDMPQKGELIVAQLADVRGENLGD
jgi:SP family arabinose:H+ symporter-like MFS transporter